MIKDETPSSYNVLKLTTLDDQILEQALKILTTRLKKPGQIFNNPTDVKIFLTSQLALKENEVFAVMYLNNKNALIEYREEFRGSVSKCAVHIRPILQRALNLNAAALILTHNHPRGDVDPSEADRMITRELKEAANIFDIRILDHIIVGGDDKLLQYSFAEKERSW